MENIILKYRKTKKKLKKAKKAFKKYVKEMFGINFDTFSVKDATDEVWSFIPKGKETICQYCYIVIDNQRYGSEYDLQEYCQFALFHFGETSYILLRTSKRNCY